MNFNINDAINAQINSELWSSYLYLSMSVNSDQLGFKGMAKWLYLQSCEEYMYAKRLINHLNESGSKVCLYTIESVPSVWDSINDIFNNALLHEGKMLRLVNGMLTFLHAEKSKPTHSLLLWLLNEHSKVQESLNKTINSLVAAKGKKPALCSLDKILGSRELNLSFWG